MLENPTFMSAQAAPLEADSGASVVALMAKATVIVRGGATCFAEEQAPVRMLDVMTDPDAIADGRESSVARPADVGLAKAGADVIVLGHAISASRVAILDVAVRTPERSIAVRVHGERVFHRGLRGLDFSPAAPFERAAITFERAYGGMSVDRGVVDWRNPAGRGVHRSTDELDGRPAPCLEDPARPLDPSGGTSPVGFGAVPMWWSPRRELAGTADAAWAAERMPAAPLDRDPRFHRIAVPSLQMTRPLREGDVLATKGLSSDGLFQVTVPALAVAVHLRRSSGPKESVPLALDTALLEPELGRAELTFRAVVPLGRGATLLREARLDAHP